MFGLTSPRLLDENPATNLPCGHSQVPSMLLSLPYLKGRTHTEMLYIEKRFYKIQTFYLVLGEIKFFVFVFC